MLNKVIWDLSVVSGEEVNKTALFSDHKYIYLENLKENLIKLLTNMNLAKLQGVWLMCKKIIVFQYISSKQLEIDM